MTKLTPCPLSPAIDAIRKSNNDVLVAALEANPGVAKGSSCLLWYALDIRSLEIVKILLEYESQPDESIMQSAMNDELFDIVKAFADARPALIWKSKLRVFKIAFSTRLTDWNNPFAADCFEHLYELVYNLNKPNIKQAHEAMNELNKVKTAGFLRGWMVKRTRRSGG